MAEYVIRTQAGDWPGFHRDRNAAVLIPAGSDWQAVDGWGDFRMARGDTTVAFSGEMNGWQVVVEGPMTGDEADQLVGIITRQVEAEVGEQCEWVRYD